jgi:cell division cycle protein 20 (cofactor of APC complex)
MDVCRAGGVHRTQALRSVGSCEQAELRQIYHENQAHSPFSRMQHRQISHTPEKILDAPDLLDDYYLNLLDWSSKNVLAVALGQTVYLWHAHTGQISQLTQTSQTDDYVASLNFSADGSQIAVGTNSAQVKLFDVEKMKPIRSMKGHLYRVSSLAWNGACNHTSARENAITRCGKPLTSATPAVLTRVGTWHSVQARCCRAAAVTR